MDDQERKDLQRDILDGTVAAAAGVADKFWLNSLEQLHRDMGKLLIKELDEKHPQGSAGYQPFREGGLLMLKHFMDYIREAKEKMK